MWIKLNSALICAIFMCIFCLEANAMGINRKNLTTEDINANPKILNGLHLKQSEFEKLDISNVLIKDLTLEQVRTFDAQFTNVTFENCVFKKTDFYRSTFSNVAFKNCKFLSLDNSTHHLKTTKFSNVVLHNVLFDATEFVFVDFNTVRGEGGYILFKNISNALPIDQAPLIDIANAHVRIENSTIHGTIAGIENVDAITKNSKYIQGGIYCDHNFILKSSAENGHQFGADKTLVIQDSLMDGDAFIRNVGYLVNNVYKSGMQELFSGKKIVSGFGIHTDENAQAYVLAKDDTPTAFRLFGGNITLKNFVLVNTLMGSSLKEDDAIHSLHLNNVKWLGGEWEGKVHSGQWENVKIEPTVVVDGTVVKNIQAYNLEFPKGEPWQKNGTFTFEVKKVNTPFTWPEIKVPTPEDLGLLWWPSVEPGYPKN